MALETPIPSNPSPFSPFSKMSTRWLDMIDCDQIPGLGTYLLVSQILQQENLSIKMIQAAARLLDPDSAVSFSIYPPRSSNPKPFIASMVDRAFQQCPGDKTARNLTESLSLFQSHWNRIDFLDFAKCWSVFTGCFLQREINQSLQRLKFSCQT